MKNLDLLFVPPCEEAVEQLNARNTCGGRDPRCEDPAFAQSNPGICGIDPRCTNPAFAEAYPQICGPSTSELVLKPASVILCKDKSTQLRTYIRRGTSETEITSGLIYRSSNQAVAQVGAVGGNVSGASEGVATLSVEWMGKMAYSQVQVMATTDCCDDIVNNIVLMVDISKSMSVAFGGTYASKLNAAKAAAVKFVNGVDYDKDAVALYSFAEAATLALDFSNDQTALLNAVGGLATGTQKTNVHEGLEEAIQAANAGAVAGSRKIVVLISDFENKLGDDPIPLANQFFESGGIIIVVGIRSNGAGFVLGNRLASGGFYINMYPAVVDDALSSLDGIKAYFCSGNCIPPGDAYASRAALNYSSLTNWDIVAGLVDLIGSGSDGVSLYDLIPGNGLYLDIAGSGPSFASTILSKQTFTFEPGIEYKLTVRLAGNQRDAASTGKAFITLGTILVAEQVDRTWAEGFVDEEFTFNVETSTTAQLEIRYAEDLANSPFGFLLDLVEIENVTGGLVVFSDDFDNENLQYIPPGCGEGTIPQPGGGYAYGYDCQYTDCLHIPPGTQAPDPIIAPEIEDSTPPTIYTATKTATVACPSGSTGPSVTRTATATSIVSQAEANTLATAEATAAATAVLVCTRPITVGDIVSIAFHHAPSEKVGFAAAGSTASDFWNSAVNDRNSLKYVDGVLSPLTLVYDVAPWTEVAIPTHPDKLMQKYAYGFNVNGDATPFNPKLGGLAIGVYDIYVYAHGFDDSENGEFECQVGTYVEATNTFTPATTYGVKATEVGSAWRQTAWVNGNQYVKFSIVIGTTGDWVRLLQTDGNANNYLITGIQIVRTGGAPDAGTVAIPGSGVSTPYPSVKFVEGRVGLITNVVLTITGLTHGYPGDIDMVLVGPDGTHVMIMSDVSTDWSGDKSVSNINLVFDDTGSNPVPPLTSLLLSGTYHTHNYFPFTDSLPAPCPPWPHVNDLLDFNGKVPNGAWKLFVNDDTAPDSGSFTNWSLTITTDGVIPPTDSDMSVSVVGTPDPVSLGGNVTYAVTLTNNGPAVATAVTLSAVIPTALSFQSYSGPGLHSMSGVNFSVNVGSILPGGVVNVTIVARAVIVAGATSVSFSVDATQEDLTPGNNSVVDVVTIVA